MDRIKTCLPIILALVLVVSCGSTTVPQNSTETTQFVVFDPSKVSQERYVTTREDIRHFIEDLNKIISEKKFNEWKNALSVEYLAEISSPENLLLVSEQPAMKRQRIVLKTAEDYFIYVVVPSRANSRVDDIEFISDNRVKAFTLNTSKAGEEQRLRLYDLEKTGDMWKIIN